MFYIFTQKRTYIFLILSITAMVAAIIVSIPDNPPGILLSFLSSVLFILAFTYNCHKAKPYVLLAVISLVGFVIGILLSNILEGIGKETFLEKIGVFFFLLAIFICPAGILIGIVGSLVQSIKRKRE